MPLLPSNAKFLRLCAWPLALACPALVIAAPSVRPASKPQASPKKASPAPKPTPWVRQNIGEQADGTALVSSHQTITPLGQVQRIEGARPKDLAVSPDGSLIAVMAQGKILLYAPDGPLKATIASKIGPLGMAWAPDGQTLFISTVGGQIQRVTQQEGTWKTKDSFAAADPKKGIGVFSAQDASALEGATPLSTKGGDPQAAGLAVSPDGKRLYVALGVSNAVSILDLENNQNVAVVRTGIAPYRLALSPDGKTLVAANRGGIAPLETEPQALSAGTMVRTDPRSDAAARGSLSFIDTQTFKAVEIAGGRQPSDAKFSADGSTLYVANSDDDTISIVDVKAHRIKRSISLRPPLDPGFGQIPTTLALSANGKTLYGACGGGNAVAVVSLPQAVVTGYLPTAWFPIAIGERDGNLFVASSKGYGSRNLRKDGSSAVHGTVGTVQFISSAQLRDLKTPTQRVALNNRWGQTELPARKGVKPVPLPERVGEPSLFKHVVYIIKENHTYDSLLGDMPEGKGDPKLCVFGGNISPNHHALARQWVLLDNTYTSGTNSADGHQWTDSAIANGYTEQNYSANVRSYPFDGGDPLAYSPKGFIWNAALKAGKSVRVYGEFVNKSNVTIKATGKRPRWKQFWDDYQAGKTNEIYNVTAESDNAALKPLLHPNYIGFPLIVPDQWRADQYLTELKTFEAKGKMPDLSILLLPSDHTSGTSPNFPTPRAQVADNDLALGRIVEGISKSKFWKETLILVIEDDSQLGLDHIDGHRTTALCISPYTRRGATVSEMYNHPSFLRTIELVLGIPAMNRFDRTASRMTACFVAKPDFTPYTHMPNSIPLDEMNQPVAKLQGERRRLALASSKLDWTDVDRADATIVARAVWSVQRPNQPFPWAKFHPNSDEDDEDEEREEREAERKSLSASRTVKGRPGQKARYVKPRRDDDD